ncbi:hypothetical protein GU926_10635 [Nibribacter ruber]|uniref:Uncharacterized protein n=1 Tax=Nibribacter ruber TaxID=2698458 RepID=A0A6P1P1V0_9BACT|nr:hypothetical protein [Nibribacter ruber]QHL87862.1 hypothetical protein GU926_10635 [Nibribacter ruber]
MKKPILIFLLLLAPLVNFGRQGAGEKLNKELICQQLEAALMHLKSNTILKGFELKFDNRIRDGWGYGSFATLYTAKKLKVTPEELWNQDKSKIGEIFNSFEDKPFKSGSKMNLDCLSKSRCANTVISKIDSDTMLFYVTTNRLGEEGSSGVILLFCFDESNNIESFHKTSWIS